MKGEERRGEAQYRWAEEAGEAAAEGAAELRAGEGRDDVRPPIAVSAAIATAAATGGGAGRGRGRPREGGEREQQPGSHGVPPPAWVCGPRGAATPFELSSPFAWNQIV